MIDYSDKATTGAEASCVGMREHDRQNYDAAIAAFTTADRILFNTNEQTARKAATAYTNALKHKDQLEQDTPPDQLQHADWTPIHEHFKTRAHAVEINPEYARLLTTAWKRHKTNQNYWTPYLKAQQHLIAAATNNPNYPEKQSDGLAGTGPEPAKYLVAIELHDLHTDRRWQEAKQIMTMYYQSIIDARNP